MGKPPNELAEEMALGQIYVDKILIWVDLALIDALLPMKELDSESITEEIMASENVLKKVDGRDYSIKAWYDQVGRIVTVNITTQNTH